MSFIISSGRRFQQPREGAPINRAHRLLRGFCTHAFVGHHKTNLITGLEPTWNITSRPQKWTEHGIAADFYNGGTVADHYSPAGAANNSTPWTYAALIENYLVNADKAIVLQAASRGASQRDRILELLSSAKYKAQIYTGSEVTLTSTTPAVADRVQAVIVSCDGSKLRMWVDGIAQTPTSCTSAGYSHGTSSVLSVGFGSLAGVSATSYSRLPLFLRLYGLAWQDGEAHQFTANPWQIFDQPARRLYSFAAAAATGGSFNAAWACGSNAVIQPGAMQ